MAYVIEKNIPAPKVRKAGKRYPFGDMEVGDSFNAGVLSYADRGRLSSAATQHAKYYGKKFTTRTDDDGNIRCWRIA